MNKKLKAWVLIAIFGALSILDCTLTWIGTPNLAMESNPLVARLGFGWFGLILSNILVFVLYIVLTYYSFVLYKKPQIKAQNAREYRKQLDKESGWSSTIAMLGFCISYSLIFARLLPIFDWLGVLGIMPGLGYRQIKILAPFSRPDLFLAVILAVLLSIYWLTKHYKFSEENKQENIAPGENLC